MNQKGRILLIILLITAALAGYLLYSVKINVNKLKTSPSPITQSSSTNETANWKIYSEESIQATFRYPQNWASGSHDSWFLNRNHMMLELTNVSGTPWMIYLDFFYGPQEQSLDQLTKSDGALSKAAVRSEITSTTFDGQPGVIVLYYDKNNVLSDMVSYVNYNGMTYGFSTPGQTPVTDALSNQKSTILTVMKSLKLIDRSDAESTWKTYQNGQELEQYKFSLNPPQGWKIQYKDGNNLHKGFAFDFAPSDWHLPKDAISWMGWGSVGVDIYPKAKTIDDSMYAPTMNRASDAKVTPIKIDDRTFYQVVSNSPVYYVQFYNAMLLGTARNPYTVYVYLGKEYTYAIEQASPFNPLFDPKQILQYFSFDSNN